jgi:hypothetical protein
MSPAQARAVKDLRAREVRDDRHGHAARDVRKRSDEVGDGYRKARAQIAALKNILVFIFF